jgi:2-polyprenyl-3-methyl-5-hydroxy-6-metoxy-1,4-benzoquinol methylase
MQSELRVCAACGLQGTAKPMKSGVDSMKMDEKLQTVLSEAPGYYQGTSGSRYFDWQNKNAEFTGRIEARKFRPYVKPTDAVLDFGCGGGHVLRSLDCAARVGVDVNPAARTAARQTGIECHESVVGLPDTSFNVIISNHALEHVEFPISVLRALRDKLVPSGLLVLCLPIDDWRTQRAYQVDDVNHHLQTWTPQLLGNSLCEAGFRPDGFSIRVLTHALLPVTTRMYNRVPELVFDGFCRMFAAIFKRRQLLAVAKKYCEQ